MVKAYLAEESIWGKSLASDTLVAAVVDAYEFLTSEPFVMDRLVQWIEE
jgi:tagaturonate reductase